jgi:molecular chaperone DnaK (HSP70)
VNGVDLEVHVTQSKYEELSKDLVKAAIHAVDDTLRTINFNKTRIDAVFVTGKGQIF